MVVLPHFFTYHYQIGMNLTCITRLHLAPPLMYGTVVERSTCKCWICGKKYKFSADFEIFNRKKSTLQNPL